MNKVYGKWDFFMKNKKKKVKDNLDMQVNDQ